MKKIVCVCLLVVLVVRCGCESASVPFLSVCQSGIREDNTNYIYCARRGLRELPLFSKNNVVYDELVLSDNRIGALSADSLARIKVKKIYLNGNPLRRIEPLAFAKLENHLEELWLDADTSATSVNAGSGEESGGTGGEIVAVEVDESVIGVPRSVTNHLRNLNTLRLKGFRIKTLPAGAFKRLARLEVLSLQFCSLEAIEELAFEGNMRNSLRELHLDGNQLQSVPTHALLAAQFRSLRVLSLAQNAIKIIDAQSFGCGSFNLNNNRLGEFNSDYIPAVSISKIEQRSSLTTQQNSLQNLTKLDVSYNGVRSVAPHALACLANTLDTLALQNNELNSFSMQFVRDLSELRELNADFNTLTTLDGARLFTRSTRLQQLSLQGNSIVFDENEYTVDTSPFSGLSSLQKLNLARNGVKKLPRGLFAPLLSLKNLILDKNHVENFNQYTFEGVYSSLLNISLQNTRLRSDDLKSFASFERIERVKIGFNELDSLDWTIFNHFRQTLINLDAQHNKIAYVSYENKADLSEMASLTELDLTNNRLCELDTSILTRLTKLRTLGLAQNPLYCDCRLLPLAEWTKARFEPDMLGYIAWQCELPVDGSAQLKRRQFTSVNPTDLKCNARTNQTESFARCSRPKSLPTTTSTTTTLSPTTTTRATATTTTSSMDSAQIVGDLVDEEEIERHFLGPATATRSAAESADSLKSTTIPLASALYTPDIESKSFSQTSATTPSHSLIVTLLSLATTSIVLLALLLFIVIYARKYKWIKSGSSSSSTSTSTKSSFSSDYTQGAPVLAQYHTSKRLHYHPTAQQTTQLLSKQQQQQLNQPPCFCCDTLKYNAVLGRNGASSLVTTVDSVSSSSSSASSSPQSTTTTSTNFCSCLRATNSTTATCSTMKQQKVSQIDEFQQNANQHHHVSLGYIPYELYNCLQSGQVSAADSQLLLAAHAARLISSNSSQIGGAGGSQVYYDQMSHVKIPGQKQQTTVAINPDHVYCEIPPQSLNNTYQLVYSDSQQQQQQHPQFFMLGKSNNYPKNSHVANSNQSAASLLISTSSSSSNTSPITTTSTNNTNLGSFQSSFYPANNNNNNSNSLSKFGAASII